MLRVTPIKNGTMTTLKVEGNLSDPWVNELRSSWAKLAKEKTAVEVDVRGLNFLDLNGAALLLEMERAGSRIFGSSPFVQDVMYCETVLLNPRIDRFTTRRS